MAITAVFAQQAVAKSHTKTPKAASTKKHHKKHNKKASVNMPAPLAGATQALS
jgi:hypothetical protein